MQNVTIVGTEDGALVLTTDNDEQFLLVVDDSVRAAVRKLSPSAAAAAAHVGPKEIQAKLREGLSPEEVGELYGVEDSYVERFAAPVLAEREYVLSQALSLPALSGQVEAEPTKTFGSSIRAKLASADVAGERWASWKDDNGWLVKVVFTLAGVERDARWVYDPRAATLTPFNDEASRLTRHAPASDGLIPRLRALDNAAGEPAPPAVKPASEMVDLVLDVVEEPAVFEDLEASDAPTLPSFDAATHDTAPVPNEATNELLEALRRRRGQRAVSNGVPASGAGSEDTIVEYPPIVSLFDSIDEVVGDPSPAHPAHRPRETPSDVAKRKRRSELPSWDEIVFGARGDEG